MKTINDLNQRAKKAIEKDDDMIYDVALELNQIAGNIKRMRWFRLQVMLWITRNTKTYAHLEKEVEKMIEE